MAGWGCRALGVRRRLYRSLMRPRCAPYHFLMQLVSLSDAAEVPFHEKSTCLKQSILVPYAKQIWSRNPRISEASNPSTFAEWFRPGFAEALVSLSDAAESFGFGM